MCPHEPYSDHLVEAVSSCLEADLFSRWDIGRLMQCFEVISGWVKGLDLSADEAVSTVDQSTGVFTSVDKHSNFVARTLL